MAQDLLKVFPECVDVDDDGYYTVNVSALNVSYVNAIKELASKINILGQGNEELLKKINSLEREIKNLKIKYKK